VGLDVRLIEGRLTVTRVEPGGAAEAAGIRTGWIITAVDNRRVDSLLQRLQSRPNRTPVGLRAVSAVNNWLGGNPGTPVTLSLLDGSDRPVEQRVVRQADASMPVKWGHFPTFFARFSSREVASGGTRVGVIWFNNWLAPLMRQVDSAVDQYRGHDGIILDLRGNTGGVAAMVSGLAGHFTTRRDTLGTNQTRTTTLYFIANPRGSTADGRQVAPFAGPVAVLTDELSASASEVFTGGMRALHRIRVFGDTSLGAVLPAVWDKLPNGDVLYHALGEFVTSTGERLEGRGVLPDQPITVTRADLLAGRDPVLEAAVRWIGSQRGTRTPGGDQ
jgi:carboxyl-terminal processing protease